MKKNKFLTALLILVVIVAALSVTALAAEGEETGVTEAVTVETDAETGETNVTADESLFSDETSTIDLYIAEYDKTKGQEGKMTGIVIEKIDKNNPAAAIEILANRGYKVFAFATPDEGKAPGAPVASALSFETTEDEETGAVSVDEKTVTPGYAAGDVDATIQTITYTVGSDTEATATKISAGDKVTLPAGTESVTVTATATQTTATVAYAVAGITTYSVSEDAKTLALTVKDGDEVTVTITVTPKAGADYAATYTVTFVVEKAEEQEPGDESSSDTTLSSITYTIGDDTTKTYSVTADAEGKIAITVPSNTTKVTVTLTATDSNAKLDLTSPVTIEATDGKFTDTTIIVTAADGTKKEYTITVTVAGSEENPSTPGTEDSDAALSATNVTFGLTYKVSDDATYTIAADATLTVKVDENDSTSYTATATVNTTYDISDDVATFVIYGISADTGYTISKVESGSDTLTATTSGDKTGYEVALTKGTEGTYTAELTITLTKSDSTTGTAESGTTSETATITLKITITVTTETATGGGTTAE